MKTHKHLICCIVFFVCSGLAYADHFPVGSIVLANCHGFFAKGKIKRLYKEQYVVNFDKDSRPVFCTPFAWSSMFLVPFKTVQEYTGKINKSSGFFNDYQDQVFKVGDRVKIDFKALSKNAFFAKKYSVVAVIKEINANGAGQLEAVEGEQVAKQVFQRWVGTNYVTLDFSEELVADKMTILNVTNP